MSDDSESLIVRMAQNEVTEPELYREARKIERDREMARIEAERKRNTEQSLPARVIEELVSGLEPGDLVPLVRLVTEAVTEARRRNDPGQQPRASAGKQDRTETGDSDRSGQESPAKQILDEERNAT